MTQPPGIVVDGQIVYVHKSNHSNEAGIVTPYTRTGSLPVRYEIENVDGSAADGELYQICCSVSSEGGYNPAGVTTSASRSNVARTVTSGAFQNLVSIRPAAATPRVDLIVRDFAILALSAANLYWEIVLNSTLGGAPAWTAVNGAGSGALSEFDITGTTSTGGFVLASADRIAATPPQPAP